MEILKRNKGKLNFKGEEGEELDVYYDNRGEPYRSGLSLSLTKEGAESAYVFLEESECEKLRNLLMRLLPLRQFVKRKK